jgi:hypothetical protein
VDCTLSGNTGTQAAGGLNVYGAADTTTVTLTDVTIAGNTGGGIENIGGNLHIFDSTISANTNGGSPGAGGVLNDGGAVTVANSIISGNTAASGGSEGVAPDVVGEFTSQGHNLIGVVTSYATGFGSSDLTGTTANPVTADLGLLANNGGLTQTMLPLTGSPAIGAGSVALIPSGVTTDQRGLPRTVDGKVDIGAVEVQGQGQGPTQVAFPGVAAGGVAGAVLSPAVTVDVENSAGAVFATDASNVTVAIASGPAGATLGGTTTVAAVNGVATFSNLTLSKAGTYTLTASDGSLTPATSTSITVTGPTQVAFPGVPASVTAGAVPSPAVTVDVENSAGAVFATDGSNVTVAIASGPAGATLGGTTTVAAANGVATFSNLTFSEAGTYTLTASDGSLAPATSSSITVIPASQLEPALGSVSLPPSVVAGSNVKGKVAVIVTNTGSALKGKVTLNLYADATTSLDGNQVLVATLMKNVSLKAGKAQSFVFNVKSLPAGLPDGTYHFLAEVVDPLRYTNVVATNQTVSAATAFVQPAITVGAVTPGSIAIGKTGSVLVTVTNNGNVAANGIHLALKPSSDGISVNGVVFKIVASSAKLMPGKSKTFKLAFKVTSADVAGTYFPYISVLLGDVTATMAGTTSFSIG